MTLVETFPGETEDQFRAAIDGLLQAEIPDRLNWWHPYEVRNTHSCRGAGFRHFFCIAGSVECWLLTILKRGGSRRILPFPSQTLVLFGPIKMYGCGEELVIGVDELAVGWTGASGGFTA
jgi:hypothetical protein